MRRSKRAKALDDHRLAMGWTIEELAGRLERESSYVGRVLSGKRPLSPRIELAAERLGFLPHEEGSDSAA